MLIDKNNHKVLIGLVLCVIEFIQDEVQMKDFNFAYKNLQKSANDLKGLHFQQSGNVESNQTTSQFAANLVKSVYDTYSADWEQFKQDLILDAKQRGYNVQQVLDNFIEPDLPEETIRVGLSGEWVSYDG